MKYIVPIHQIKYLSKLTNDSDGLFFGNDRFGTRLTQSYNIHDINEMIEFLYASQKASFLMCQQMMTDDDLYAFKAWIQNIHTNHLTGIIVADIGAVMVLKDLSLHDKVIYHPETLHTNDYDFNDLSAFHISGAFVGKEITIDDILRIGKHKKHQLFMIGHGHLNMFYSRRYLLEHYTNYAQLAIDLKHKKTLRIKEEERPNEMYPVMEDQAGTHIFRAQVFHTSDDLLALSQIVDYLFLDTIFKDDSYTIDVLKLYKKQNMHIKQQLIDQYKETWDKGFLYQKTIYKK